MMVIPALRVGRRMARAVKIACASAAMVCISESRLPAAISITEHSGTNWSISNGPLSVTFDPASNNLTSISLSGSGNLLDPSDSQLYPEFAGTPFGSGTATAGYQQTGNYIDFWNTTASAGTTNPITYSFHYVMFNNDPTIQAYEVLNHASTDPATSVGQGQFLARLNGSDFNNTYQYNVGPFNIGPQTSTLQNVAAYNTAAAVAGRQVQNAAVDLNGTGLAGDWGSEVYTKYDYSSYTQFWQASVEYGATYSAAAVIPSADTMSGGPTKQNLMFTNNILMQEFLSGHLTNSDSYNPPTGVDSSRLFGPFAFQFGKTGTQTGAQLYQDAINAIPTYLADYQTDNELISSGYVPLAQRGSVQISAGDSAGWSSNTVNNTVVLSDPGKNFQESASGYQYWAQLPASGDATIGNIVPGTYRMTLYELGQWGETRVDGVTVDGGHITIPQNLKFTPENFGTAPPIWTIGTPDRSAHEFLNGENTSTTNGVTAGGGIRQYQGDYNYWLEEQNLGNPGKVVYYATAVGATPATNNTQAWIANQWGTFDPGLYAGVYSSTDLTTDGYTYIAPTYVGNPATYSGSPWEVHFAVTSAQKAQGQYAVLSVGLAAFEASLTVSLNGHAETWHYNTAEASDAMVRSGAAGFYQMLAYQFPVADLSAVGADNDLTFSVSSSEGVMYDALRMEITNTSAAPSTTGWNDYDYIYGTNSQTNANDAVGLSLPETIIVPEPSSVSLMAAGAMGLLLCRRRRGERE
jgi:hypothetical protein